MGGKVKGVEPNPHIVEEHHIGNTCIRIADNYCVSREEAERIMERLAEKLQPILIAQMAAKEKAG